MRRNSLLLILILSTFSLFAQKSNRSLLNIRLSDGSPLIVTLNNRDYKKVNTNISIGDIPGKRHQIVVYRFRPYSDGKGGKAELVYSGRIKVQPGNTYDCIVDVKKSKFLMKNIGVNTGVKPERAAPIQNPSLTSNTDLNSEKYANLSQPMRQLRQQMLSTKADTKKLEVAQAFVQRQAIISTDELKTISDWIMFDDNKMTLLKSSYENVSDKSNFINLKDVFTMTEAKINFEKFINEK